MLRERLTGIRVIRAFNRTDYEKEGLMRQTSRSDRSRWGQQNHGSIDASDEPF